MNQVNRSALSVGAFVIGSAAALGCATDSDKTAAADLTHRAYIIARESDDLTVIDLDTLEIIGRAHTLGVQNHMAELNATFTKLYVDSEQTDESIVVDATTLKVVKRIPTGAGPTHLSLSRDGTLLAVMNEYSDQVSFIDPEADVEIKRLDGFNTPHFMRFPPSGPYGYVANIGAHHITRVDLGSLEIADHIALDGFEGPPNATMAPAETGFADVQIDPDGVLYAAHNLQARVLVYDTARQVKMREVEVGPNPWIAYAEVPFTTLPRRQVVPAFGDSTVSLMRRDLPVASLAAGDMQSFGVNYSPLTPNKAFVMNRVRQDITVVDTALGTVTASIATGGTTETASTTADGKWIVATVSSSNQVVVIDAMTNQVVKTFDDVGKFPWSVTIPLGQNYCH